MTNDMSASGPFGAPPQRDWNALSDDAFRALVRNEFEPHYPSHLRYVSQRLRWSELAPWYRRMATMGWIAPAWPQTFGGMGLSASKLLIFLEEQERWGIARYQDHGVLMVGPLLIRYGTPGQQARYLPRILSCTEIWCQGYSEPDAGSDLASLRTRADRVAGGYLISGQKTWTTLAHDATHIFLLARTDPSARKQEGIGFFLIDLGSPGITVRPIRDIAGHEEFCEVFLDRVAVPDDGLLGAPTQGWSLAKSLLGFERVALGSPKLCEYGLQILDRVARATGAAEDPVLRDRAAALRLDVVHLGDIYRRFCDDLVRGNTPGHEVSLLKIWSTETFQRIADLTLDAAGPLSVLSGRVAIGGDVIDVLGAWYKSRPATIYGGSNEVQRNVLAKQVLKLPSYH